MITHRAMPPATQISRAALLLGATFLLACSQDGRGIGASEGLLAPRDANEALNELQELYAASVEREMASLSVSKREAVLAGFRSRSEMPGTLRMRFTAAGTPKELLAPGFRVGPEDLGLPADASREDTAHAFVRRYAVVWRVTARDFARADLQVREHRGPTGVDAISYEYRQRHAGLPVIGGTVSVHIELASSAVVGVNGSFLNVDAVDPTPSITPDDAVAVVTVHAGERPLPPELVIWSEYRSGSSDAARLSYRVKILDVGDGPARFAYVDAHTAALLGGERLGRDALRRSLWDLRTQSGYGSDTCQRWQLRPPVSSYPGELSGCPPQCTPCLTDVGDCTLCTCEDIGFDPTGCETTIWRYDETTGCVADGDPLGEANCDSEALTLWTHAGDAYSYWASAFGRDSWDDDGGWLWLKVNPDPGSFGAAGRTQPKFVDDDGAYDAVQVTIADGATAPQLDGHELGHSLQYGTYTYEEGESGFHDQGVDVLEHNADAHSFRYRGLAFQPGYRCDHTDLLHYSQFRSNGAGQSNKFIGNCQGWLMTNGTGTGSHYGVSVGSTSLTAYDQVWYRAMDLHFRTSHDYFDWWDQLTMSAYEIYGFGGPYFSARDASDAIGSWTGFASVTSAIEPADRYAAVGWQGGTFGPCVFYRIYGNTTDIYWRCYSPNGWTPETRLNDPAVDPAASEPAATFRWESPGKFYAYVLWRGTDSRIHYRRLDVDTLTVGPPLDLGSSHLASGPPAAAPVFESSARDRLVVAYHPLSTPTWFFSTYLGSTDPPLDLGPALDSDAPPSLVSYPYSDRVYFVRPDFASGSTPRHIRYASYTMAGGGSWSAPPGNDLTALYNADPFTPTNAVRTDGGVALAEYARTPSERRLRMVFVTKGDGTGGASELWYATVEESSPGVLSNGEYRAVPLAPLTGGSSQSAGGLAVGVQGYPLWHFWGPGGPVIPKLFEWRMYSD